MSIHITDDGKEIQEQFLVHTHTHTLVRPQSPETWLREQSYRSVGWQARMDEQAGLQEHQRTALVPPNPLITPPKHPHQRWESARPTALRVTLKTTCSGDAPYCSCVRVQETLRVGSGRPSGGGGEAGGYSQDSTELSCPWTTFTSCSLLLWNTQTAVKRSLPVSAGAWWEKVVCRWLLIGPQGPWGRVTGDAGAVVYVFLSHMESSPRMAKVWDEQVMLTRDDRRVQAVLFCCLFTLSQFHF